MCFYTNNLRMILPVLFMLITGSVSSADSGGYLFYGSGTKAYLMDMSGTVQHTWSAGGSVQCAAYLLEDGSVLFPFSGSCSGASSIDGAHPHGRIQKIAWDGTVTWDYTFCPTGWGPGYDIEPMPNGNVLVPADNKTSAGIVYEIKPSGSSGGDIVWQCQLPDSLNASGTYINSVSYNPDLDYILIDLQEPARKLVVIDHSIAGGTIVYTYTAATSGRLHGAKWAQKYYIGTTTEMAGADTTAMRVGNLLVVNNSTSVVEVNMKTNTKVKTISYSFNTHEGSVQRLPNGNTLVQKGMDQTVIAILDDNGTVLSSYSAKSKCNRAYWYGADYAGVSNLAQHYSVIYSGNGNTGGSVPADANDYAQNATVTVAGNTGNLSKTGYTFAGWNTAADGTGTSYAVNATFTMGTSDVTLYAQWTQVQTYSVIYNGNGNDGGAVPADPNAYIQNATVTVAGNTGNVSKTGYTFAGWNTAADGTGMSYAVNATFTMGTSNVTLYAQWTQVQTYSVIYNGNGNDDGVVPADPNAYIQSATVTVAGNTGNVSKTGYTFIGWNTAADGTGTSYAVNATFTMGTSDVTLYAQWTQVQTYSVIYNGNENDDGDVPTDANAYIQNATVTVAGNTGNVSKTGYTFAGWNTAADGSGISYAVNTTFTMGTSDVTLYAQWTQDPTYTVIYNGNGNDDGDVPTDANAYVQNAMVTVTGNTGNLTRSGYTFAGWNTVADGSGISYAVNTTFSMSPANVVLFAQWTIVHYTLTVNTAMDQNISEKIRDTVVQHGDTIQVTAPLIEGGSFLVWRVTTATALLLDSAQSACRVVLKDGDAGITAMYSLPVSAQYVANSVPTQFDLSYQRRNGRIVFAVPAIPGSLLIPVNIRLFDINGKLLGEIVEKALVPGFYSVNPNIRGKDAVKIMICRMQAPGYSKTVTLFQLK